jgi:hypothetical protein
MESLRCLYGIPTLEPLRSLSIFYGLQPHLIAAILAPERF